MKDDKFKPHEAWKKVFPEIRPRTGMYVKCIDGRTRDGFFIGEIISIHRGRPSYGRLIRLKTVPYCVTKRAKSIMHKSSKAEYIKWAKKKWISLGKFPVHINGRLMLLKKREIVRIRKVFGCHEDIINGL